MSSTRHIGIIGFRESGKTVLLTSLINHILYHDPDQFPLDGRKRIQLWDPKFMNQAQIDGWSAFDYTNIRKRMTENLWPRRTTDCSVAHLQFHKGRPNGWWDSLCDLYLYDIPGERTDDFCMLTDDFRRWSHNVQSLISIHHDLAEKQGNETDMELVSSFQDQLTRDIVDERDLLTYYKMLIARFYKEETPINTPSLVLLDENGIRYSDKAKGTRYLKESIEKCTSGLPGKEFIPVPDRWFDEPKGTAKYRLVHKFEANYKEYVKQIIMPIIRKLSSCYGLICLVDFPMILKRRHSEINRYSQLVEKIITCLKPDTRRHWFGSHIHRLAFACPKADLFHPDDRPNIESLLHSITEPYIRNHRNISFQYYVCSAFVTTRKFGENTMFPFNSKGENGEEVAFPCVRVPWIDDFPTENEEWFPSTTDEERFCLPENVFSKEKNIPPVLPKNEARVPQQIGLNDLFREITDWF